MNCTASRCLRSDGVFLDTSKNDVLKSSARRIEKLQVPPLDTETFARSASTFLWNSRLYLFGEVGIPGADSSGI